MDDQVRQNLNVFNILSYFYSNLCIQVSIYDLSLPITFFYLYFLLAKSNYRSIINAAFWLVELILGYMS